jgi:hypothetical protein
MDFLPCPELLEVLLPAYRPCRNFAGTCEGRVGSTPEGWRPEKGHVPRGFIGAFGTLDDVKLVLVVAEPADPLPGEQHFCQSRDAE